MSSFFRLETTPFCSGIARGTIIDLAFLLVVTLVMLVGAYLGDPMRNVRIILCKFYAQHLADLRKGIHVNFLRNDNFGTCGRKNFNLNI